MCDPALAAPSFRLTKSCGISRMKASPQLAVGPRKRQSRPASAKASAARHSVAREGGGLGRSPK
jgi:hypothetical protein